MPIHLSIIIPAYNEEKRIGETLRQILEYLKKQDYNWEVIVVDDASDDETSKIVQAAGSGIKIIHNPKNFGKGYAVRVGMLRSSGDYCLMMDADNSTPIGQIENLWKYAGPEVIVIGSRYKDPSSVKIQQPKYRVALGRFANWIIQKLIVAGVVDTQCGFKLFPKELAQELFARQTINRWGFDFEILGMAARFGYDIKEIPVAWFHAGSSRVRPIRAYPKTLLELLKIKWRFMTGKYKEKNGSW